MMLLRRRIRRGIFGAAGLALCAAFAYQSLAATQLTATAFESIGGGRQIPVLRGKVPIAFGAFELSVSFTPDGRIKNFHLDSAGAKRCGEV